MRSLSKYLLSAVVILLALFLLPACKKQNYRTDGGLAQANTTLSTYDYLKQNPDHLFDTTILLIDHFNLKDSVNKAGTFFAFTNYEVTATMTVFHSTSLEDFYTHITPAFLTQYLFTDSITLSNTPTTTVGHTSWANLPAGARTVLQSYVSQNTTFNYYVLQYVQVNGLLDGAPGTPVTDSVDNYLPCQTTGVKTATGTTLNVLVNNATLKVL